MSQLCDVMTSSKDKDEDKDEDEDEGNSYHRFLKLNVRGDAV